VPVKLESLLATGFVKRCVYTFALHDVGQVVIGFAVANNEQLLQNALVAQPLSTSLNFNIVCTLSARPAISNE
jgi:hypothetical protein